MKDDLKNKIHFFLVRLAAALIFASFGIWEMFVPAHWIGFVPHFLVTAFSAEQLVILHGMTLTCIAAAFFCNYSVRIAAIAGFALMLQIIAFLIIVSGVNEIVIRDICIGVTILSLAFAYE